MAGMDLIGTAALLDGFDDMVDTFSGDSDGYRIGTPLEYGPPQEFGTAYQNGTPHFRPGMDATRAKLGQIALQASDLDEFLKLAALQWQSETQSRAPVEYGTLQASYQVDEL